jgi:predicted RNase H-like nuclease (RuvC/YqgF family)
MDDSGRTYNDLKDQVDNIEQENIALKNQVDNIEQENVTLKEKIMRNQDDFDKLKGEYDRFAEDVQPALKKFKAADNNDKEDKGESESDDNDDYVEKVPNNVEKCNPKIKTKTSKQRAKKLCDHKKRKDNCAALTCSGCKHGRLKYQCRECNSNVVVCDHGKRKAYCVKCNK